MRKLTQKNLDALAEVSSEVADLFAELEVERELFTGKVQRILEQIVEAKEPAREIVDDAAMAAEDYYDNRSEAWVDSDKGSAYGEWRDRLREVADAIAEDFEGLEVPEIDIPHWVSDLADPDFAEFEYED